MGGEGEWMGKKGKGDEGKREGRGEEWTGMSPQFEKNDPRHQMAGYEWTVSFQCDACTLFLLKTRQLSYRKEDRAMPQYMGALKSFESPHHAPGNFSRNL